MKETGLITSLFLFVRPAWVQSIGGEGPSVEGDIGVSKEIKQCNR